MPVTAKLSRNFYDRLGDEIANELVNWFNKVDETYRADLRELNELNFARFDAKLEQRLAELGADVRAEIAALRVEMHREIGSLRGGIMRWMFGLWATQMLATVGLFISLMLRGS